MLQPPNYAKDYSLHMTASLSTIGMVLVQTDEHDQEHVIYYSSKRLLDSETRYSHVEKPDLATDIAVHKFYHYIFLRTTIVYPDSNPMYYVLTRQVLGSKYSCWIVILQGFDLEFTKSTSKKSLVFAEIICDLIRTTENIEPSDSLPDESLFLISTTDPWYGDIILYLQTLRYQPTASRYECRHVHHQTKSYLILNDTLYRRGVDSILRRFLTH